MQTQFINKELTGFKAEISGIKITDTEDVIRDAIISSVREVTCDSIEWEAKFEINIESDECDFICKGRLCDDDGMISLYEFDITAIKDQPVYFSINGQTQYDFINSIVEEVDITKRALDMSLLRRPAG